MEDVAIFQDEFVTIISPVRNKRPKNVRRISCPFCNIEKKEPIVYELKENGIPPIRVVKNKFPLLNDSSTNGYGFHEVVIETPLHELRFWDLTVQHISGIIRAWGEREKTHYSDPRIQFVAIYKNYGTRAGASIEHEHSQILAMPLTPLRVRRKIEVGLDNHEEIFRGKHWKLALPLSPRFPYEVHILPLEPVFHVFNMSQNARLELALFLKKVLSFVGKTIGAYNLFVFTSPKNELLPVHVEVYPRLGVHAGLEIGAMVYGIHTPKEEVVETYRNVLNEDLVQ